MTAQPAVPRVSRARFFTGAWLTLLSVFVVIEQVRLSALNDALSVSADRSDVAAIQEQVAFHAESVAALINAPPSVREETLNNTREALDHRISEVEQLARNTQARVSDIEALQAQVRSLETRVAKAHRTLASSAPPQHTQRTAQPKPAVPEPPFTPLGMELRGGERFLSIAPAGATSLGQARVLRIGDSEGDWTLLRLDRHVAEFQIAGQLQRIVVP